MNTTLKRLLLFRIFVHLFNTFRPRVSQRQVVLRLGIFKRLPIKAKELLKPMISIVEY